MLIARRRKADERISVADSMLTAIGAFILATNELSTQGQANPQVPQPTSAARS